MQMTKMMMINDDDDDDEPIILRSAGFFSGDISTFLFVNSSKILPLSFSRS